MLNEIKQIGSSGVNLMLLNKWPGLTGDVHGVEINSEFREFLCNNRIHLLTITSRDKVTLKDRKEYDIETHTVRERRYVDFRGMREVGANTLKSKLITKLDLDTADNVGVLKGLSTVYGNGYGILADKGMMQYLSDSGISVVSRGDSTVLEQDGYEYVVATYLDHGYRYYNFDTIFKRETFDISINGLTKEEAKDVIHILKASGIDAAIDRGRDQ